MKCNKHTQSEEVEIIGDGIASILFIVFIVSFVIYSIL